MIINVSSFFLVVLIVDRGPVTNTTEFFTCNAGSSKWLVRQPTHSDLEVRLFGATNKVLNLNKYQEVQYGDQSLFLMNTLSSLVYKTPSLLTTKSSNNPSLGSKFLYKILYASQTNDEFLQISLLRQSLSIKGSLSFSPQYYLDGKVSIS